VFYGYNPVIPSGFFIALSCFLSSFHPFGNLGFDAPANAYPLAWLPVLFNSIKSCPHTI
jgi:hypothetical protein